MTAAFQGAGVLTADAAVLSLTSEPPIVVITAVSSLTADATVIRAADKPAVAGSVTMKRIGAWLLKQPNVLVHEIWKLVLHRAATAVLDSLIALAVALWYWLNNK